ncbi:MAG: hypothetical protein FWD38_06155 [Oscillospiraceae bacterium]|nr:hypothetical protein [Oscillospiraceae bacterium]
MAIYSKTLSDDRILSLIPENKKHILLVACGGCVNESLAYDHDNPILVFDDENNSIPYASKVEAKRISAVLETSGCGVEIKLLTGDMPVLCIYSESDTSILDTMTNPDLILTISCASGAMGMKFLTDTPVISITHQVGYVSYTYRDADSKRLIIKESSRCQMI